MTQLVLHPQTSKQLQVYASSPSHALLIVGPSGSGKLSIAIDLAEKALELETGQFESYPYKSHIQPEEGKTSISIEAVRQLEQFLALKVPTQKATNRVVIIEDAHWLTTEAQNAILKTLEEPPAGVLLLLTTASEQALLPTIRSRAQSLHVAKPTSEGLKAHFGSKYSDDEIKQAYAVSGGLPGLMQALLSDEEHPLTAATAMARRLLSATTYERLLIVDELAKQKQLAQDTAFILQQMARLSLQTVTGQGAAKWQRILKASYEAAEQLKQSAQPKLCLTNLMLNM